MQALPILTCEPLNVTTSVRGEWSWHVNSIVACCHSAKLCAYAARHFRSQHSKAYRKTSAFKCFLRCSDAFRKFSPCEVYEKVLGALSLLHPKTKLFALEFRRILEILCLQFCRKGSRRIFMIFASKNEAVCREVLTHFGSSPHSRFTKRFHGAFSRFMRPKAKLFSVKFRGILEVFSMQALWRSSWRTFTINASKNVTVCREVQTRFGTSPLARFIEKVMGEISRFMRLKTKLFAVKLRRILEVFSVQAL